MIKKIISLTSLFCLIASPAIAENNLKDRQIMRKEIRQEKQEMRKEMKEKIKETRAEKKEFFRTIKDRVKKMRAQNLQERINNHNTNRTKMMLARVEEMKKRLKSLSEKISSLKTQGKDVSRAEASFSSAQSALYEVQKAIQAQAQKQYTFDITKEVLGNAVGLTLKQVNADLQTVEKMLNSASEKIAQVRKDLAGL